MSDSVRQCETCGQRVDPAWWRKYWCSDECWQTRRARLAECEQERDDAWRIAEVWKKRYESHESATAERMAHLGSVFALALLCDVPGWLNVVDLAEQERDRLREAVRMAEAQCAALSIKAERARKFLDGVTFTGSDAEAALVGLMRGILYDTNAGAALLAELEAARTLVEAARLLDEDGTPTNDWNAIMAAIADYDRVRDGVKP